MQNKFFPALGLISALMLSTSIYANGADTSSPCATGHCGQDMTYLPMSDRIYRSGVYVGIDGGYSFTDDNLDFDSDNFNYAENHRDHHYADGSSINGGVFIGYGYLFNHGNLPYLGAEIGANARSTYNSCSDDHHHGEGCLFGKTINSTGDLSFDILPGVFWNDTQTTLFYGRLGVEGDQFRLHSYDENKYQYDALVRAGAGIEHEIVNGFYLRLDYIFAIDPDRLTFREAGNSYFSKVMFNTLSAGLSYRFGC
jgi:opacity protein-like surface antigen